MNRPGLVTYLLGNVVSFFALFDLVLFLAYEWWAVHTSPAPAILAGLAFVWSMGAREKIENYRHWKREWDAMEGRPPPQPLMARIRANPVLRFSIGLPLWFGMAYLVWHANDPVREVGIAFFSFATVLMIGSPVYARIRQRKQVAAVRREEELKDLPVMLCLRAPQQSPSVQQAYAALPGYCAALMQRYPHR